MIIGRALASARSFSPFAPYGNSAAIPRPGDDPGLYPTGNVTAGIVSERIALRASGVYSCAGVIVDDVSTLPIDRVRRRGEGRREVLPAPSLFRSPLPGEIEDLPEWLGRLLISLVLRGNLYARVLDVDDIGATAVDPLHPENCRPFRDNGRLRFRVTGYDGKVEILDPWPLGEIWHVKGLTLPGSDEGLSPLGHAMMAITLALATEQFGAQLFLDGAMPSAVLTTTEKFPNNDTGKARARQVLRNFERIHRGRRRTALLEGGADWKPVTLAPNEAQFIETRKFQLEEIARIFRVKPHKIGILDRATFSNIEQQSLEHVTDTLRPWIVRLEHGLDRLFPFADPEERCKFNLDALLRGDLKTRYEAYAIGRQWGWETPDSILTLEDRDPLADGGAVALQPLNMRDAALPSLAERAKAVQFLVDAGYDPAAAATVCDFADLPHTGVIPKATNLLPEDPSAKPEPGLPDTPIDDPGAPTQ